MSSCSLHRFNVHTCTHTYMCMTYVHVYVIMQVPLLLDDIDNEGHPVEVGLADAFYVYQDVRVGAFSSLSICTYIYNIYVHV